MSITLNAQNFVFVDFKENSVTLSKSAKEKLIHFSNVFQQQYRNRKIAYPRDLITSDTSTIKLVQKRRDNIVAFLIRNGITEDEIIFPLGGGGSCHANTQSLRIATKEECLQVETNSSLAEYYQLNKYYKIQFEEVNNALNTEGAMTLFNLILLFEKDTSNSILIQPIVTLNTDSSKDIKVSEQNWNRTNLVVNKLVQGGIPRKKIIFTSCGSSDFVTIKIQNYNKLGPPPFPNLKR